MNFSSHHPQLKWYHSIPGLYYFKNERRLFGVAIFLAFIFFPIIAVANISHFIDSIVSLFLSIIIFVFTFGSRVHLFRTDVIEWWLATSFLIIVPIFMCRWTRKMVLREMESSEDHHESPIKIGWKKFLKNRHGYISLCVIFGLYTVAFLCPYLSPCNPNAQSDIPVTKYKTPCSSVKYLSLKNSRIPPLDVSKEQHPTFIHSLEQEVISINYRLTDLGISKLMFVNKYRVEGDSVYAIQAKNEIRLSKKEFRGDSPEEWESSRFYFLGSDRFGRDIFSRLIYGSRVSLSLGLIAVILSVIVGTSVGLFSGYVEGRIDSVLMRFVDMLLAFPTIFFILIIIALFEKIPISRILLVVLVLGLTSWMSVARLVRGQVLSLKHQDYILAAKAMGFGFQRIIFRHILPNVLTPIIINATMRLGGIILIEAALSFLNLGVQPPTPSWGNIIYEGKDFITNAWWVSTFPGIAIVITVVSFNLFGDGLRDAMDPRM